MDDIKPFSTGVKREKQYQAQRSFAKNKVVSDQKPIASDNPGIVRDITYSRNDSLDKHCKLILNLSDPRNPEQSIARLDEHWQC
jgi:hypothetical protein